MPQTETQTVPPQVVKAIEHRAEIPSLDQLQQERRTLMKKYAPLAAKFKGGTGQGSSSDAARKRHRALISQKILVELRQKWEKETPQMVESKKTKGLMVPRVWEEPSETALERMANAHTDHIEFCNKLEQDFVAFVLLENDIQDIREQIQSRAEELRAYTGELYLQRG